LLEADLKEEPLDFELTSKFKYVGVPFKNIGWANVAYGVRLTATCSLFGSWLLGVGWVDQGGQQEQEQSGVSHGSPPLSGYCRGE
jgi:hypothetical protein